MLLPVGVSAGKRKHVVRNYFTHLHAHAPVTPHTVSTSWTVFLLLPTSSSEKQGAFFLCECVLTSLWEVSLTPSSYFLFYCRSLLLPGSLVRLCLSSSWTMSTLRQGLSLFHLFIPSWASAYKRQTQGTGRTVMGQDTRAESSGPQRSSWHQDSHQRWEPKVGVAQGKSGPDAWCSPLRMGPGYASLLFQETIEMFVCSSTPSTDLSTFEKQAWASCWGQGR